MLILLRGGGERPLGEEWLDNSTFVWHWGLESNSEKLKARTLTTRPLTLIVTCGFME